MAERQTVMQVNLRFNLANADERALHAAFEAFRTRRGKSQSSGAAREILAHALAPELLGDAGEQVDDAVKHTRAQRWS